MPLFAFSLLLKEENLTRENAYPWAVKWIIFVSALALWGFQFWNWDQLSGCLDSSWSSYTSVKTRQSSEQVWSMAITSLWNTTSTLFGFYYYYYYYFSKKDPNHLTCPSSSSHVNTLIKDLVFPRIILKSQDYYILVLCHTFMTCLMLFKETGFHHQIHKMQQWKTIHFIKLCLTLKNWCLRTVVLEKTLESPLNCKENKPVNPKGNQLWIFIGKTDAEAEIPILWPPDVKSWLTAKDPDAGKDWGQKENRVAEDEMVRQHHWLNGHESEQTPGNSEGQGNLLCCRPWGHKESDMT